MHRKGREIHEIIERVRALREIAGTSAEELAAHLGFDPKEYADWEAGEADFPVGALVEIAGHFHVDLSDLLTGNSSRLKTFCLSRAGEGVPVSRRECFSYWNLAYHFHGKKAEPFLVEAKEHTSTPQEPFELNRHPGQEFDYVIEGNLLVSVGGRNVEMHPGDSIYFDSREAHGMRAVGGTSRFLAIVFAD